MDYKLEGNCYVIARGRDDNGDAYLDLMYHKYDMVTFPEDGMRFIDTATYLPYNKSIVTENPFLISSYDKYSVWVLKKGKWVNPNEQTFGCSVNVITSNILGFDSSIPLLPYIKIRSLVGDIPKGCMTYQDYADKIEKDFKDFKYDDY